MQYVKTKDMKLGTKIAKPIYNKDGVLLYKAGSKVNIHMLSILTDLNLYGTYILDAAEPVPPITPEESEFERFQWVQTFTVDSILSDVIAQRIPEKLPELVDLLYHSYGYNVSKMTFNQCLRGENDFICKHSLNVAILTALIAGTIGLEAKECKYLIEAAIFHDIGKLLVPRNILNNTGTLSVVEMNLLYEGLLEGFTLLSNNYAYPAGVRRYLIQLFRDLSNRLPSHENYQQTLLPGTKIIQVADIYDTLTAVRSYKAPMSPFSALKIIRADERKYDPKIVAYLQQCINILPAGSYVMLSNKEQGIVVSENSRNIERPTVLGLSTNNLYDLSMKNVYEQIHIVDTVFTPDNRQQIQYSLS